MAEMLFSSVPFLDALGLAPQWKVIRGSRTFFEITKTFHNLLQGMKGAFTPEMRECYADTIEEVVGTNIIEKGADVVLHP